MSDFCHLHLHTEYSLLDGVSKIRPLLQKIKESGMKSCAITDHGVLYGAFEFWNTAKELELKPIIGCEVYVANGSRFDRAKDEDGKKYSHLTLLAKNHEGYRNLLKLVSRGFKEGFYYKPRVDRELLEMYSKGLICLTGCPGSFLNRNLLQGNIKEATDWMEFMGNTFDDLYFELMRANISELSPLEPKQIEFNKKYKLPYVATVDSHYIEPDDFKIQEIAWCIADGKQITDPAHRQYGSREFYVKKPEEMSELFADIPEAVENTVKISEIVEKYDITFKRIQPKYYNLSPGESSKDQITKLAHDRLKDRYEVITDDMIKRLNYELEVIDQKGYNDYFLVVQDYCKWAKENDIMVGPGRGSGAGSLVAYSLGITNIDPLRFELLFERFLNPERDSPPDFDIDFQDDKRDELFKYMSEKYGSENTSFIGTFGRLKTKAAIRDVARVMGIDLKIADQLSKMVIVKFGRVHTIDMMMKEVPEFAQMINGSEQLQELAGYVRKLENIARHVSIHACGYLVTPQEITDYVPVYKEAKNEGKIVTQVEGAAIEYLGLMKFDFLGLANLTIIKNALQQIEYVHKKKIDIDKIPLDDEKTFELFRKGNTTGIFQFESDGMKKYLRDLEPTELEDLIFMTSAYRPGPMKYIPDYIARKKGKQEATYLHPILKTILESTFGFAIYQEQVIRIAVEFVGYSMGQADILRRAMGKKKPEIMEKEKGTFVEKAMQKGHSKEIAEQVFAYLEPFADYGFNRSHAAAYSMISYQTAYLKANYPLEFMAGLMQSDLDNSDKISRDLQEAKEMGIKVLPPDINESYVDFKIEKGKAIRFGLGAIKNSSEKIMKNIIDERKLNGKFKSLNDLVTRVTTEKITKKDIECLVKVGAMDQYGTRNQLLAISSNVYDATQNDEKRSGGGQASFFSNESNISIMNSQTPLPQIEKESDQERILWEKELLGTFLSSHPLEKFAALSLHKNFYSFEQINRLKDQEQVQILAIISAKKVIYTKKDAKAMAFIELQDATNKMEGVIFPTTYLRLINSINENTAIIVTGKVSLREDKHTIIIDDIQDAVKLEAPKQLTIDITNEKDRSKLEELKELVTKNPGKINLKILYGSNHNRGELIKKIAPNPRLADVLKRYQIA